MALTEKKQINALITTPIVVSGFATANGASNDVTTAIGARLTTAGYNGTALSVANSANETAYGFVTTAGRNRVEIYDVTNKRRLRTTDGYVVYGRISYSIGVYTLTYYYKNAVQAETATAIAGPITINFVVNYRSKFVSTPLDENVTAIAEQFNRYELNLPIRIENLYAGANNKWITSDGSGKFLASLNIDALSVPFTSGAGIVAVNVAAALDELKGTPFPAVMTVDLVLDNGFRILPNNGLTFIDLRYTADNNLLLGSKYDKSQSWALFNATAAKIAFGANSYLTFGATSSNLYSANIFLGLNNEFSAESNGVIRTTTNVDKMVVAASAKNITIQAGVVNTIAAGGFDYNVKTSNALYTSNLVLPDIGSGFEALLVPNTLAGDIAVFMPKETSNLIYADTFSVGSMTYYENTDGKLAISIITHDTTANATIAINDTFAATVLISASTYNIAGDQTTLSLKAIGALSNTNKGLIIETANGLVDNIALEIVSGNIIQTTGQVALNAAVDAVVQINTTTSTLSIGFRMVNSTPALAAIYGGVLTATGASTKNVALYLNATAGTTNYSLIAENGNAIFGGLTSTTVDCLMEFVSTTKAVKFNEMTDVQMSAIIAPTSGMFVYNTTYSQFYFYNGATWLAVAGSTQITGSGTTNTIPKFTAGQAIGNSTISDSGTLVKVLNTVQILNGVSTASYTTPAANSGLYVEKYSAVDLIASHYGATVGTLLDTQSITNNTNYLIGLAIVAAWNQTDAHNLTLATGSMEGTRAEVDLTGTAGILTLAHGVHSRINTTAGTTCTTFNAFKATIALTNLGTVSNFRGLWIPDMSAYTGVPAATLRYGLYQSDPGTNYLAGSLGIANATVDASALFDVASTTKGVVFPRMSTAQKDAISAPVEGLIVYDTTLHKLCVYSNQAGGAGTKWETITSALE